MPGDFEQLWDAHREQVFRYCRSYLGNGTDVDDVMQLIATRAWRGLPSFRRDSSFLTWIMKITANEVNRQISKRQRERQRLRPWTENTEDEVSLLLMSHRRYSEMTEHHNRLGSVMSFQSEIILEKMLTEAQERGVLDPREVMIVRSRLEDFWARWDDTGLKIGISGDNAAAIYCRAIPKLRVLFFCHYVEFCEGTDLIASAFDRARTDKSVPLTELESRVFQRHVLERAYDFRKRGWEIALRSACKKVARHLDGSLLPEPGALGRALP